MRKVFMPVIVVALLVVACEKDRADVSPDNAKVNTPVESNSFSTCTGNEWNYAATYAIKGIGMTYDNKLYVPDKLTMTVRIYDGTSWTSIPSAVPFYTYNIYAGGTANSSEIAAF